MNTGRLTLSDDTLSPIYWCFTESTLKIDGSRKDYLYPSFILNPFSRIHGSTDLKFFIQPTKLQQQQHVSAFTDCMCILYTLTDKTESYGYRLSICVSNWNIIIIGSPEVIFIVITSPQSRKPGIILQIPDPDIMYLWNTCPLAFWQVVEHWTYCTRIIVNWIDIGPNM